MIFKRREKRSLGGKLRDIVAPKKGWRRGFKYIGRRVQRLPDTPHRIALGFACGSMASFTPFFTLHALIAVILSWITRGNLLAGAFGTIVGNPLTFPFIAAACIKMGNILTGRNLDEGAMDKFTFSYLGEHPFEFLEGIFTPYLIGGIIPGLVVSAILYFLLRPMVASFQRRRRDILADRARDLVHRRRGGGDPGAGSGGASSSGGRSAAHAKTGVVERSPIPPIGETALPHRPPV